MMFPADTPAPDAISRILDAPDDRPFVVGQLGQSLDGRIATPTGESRWINGQVALTHLHAVRAAVDAVVVGVGTVIADDPQLNVRLVAMPEGGLQPARVVLDPKGRTPARARLFDAATGGPAIQVVDDVVGRSMTMTDTPPAQHILLPTDTGRFGPREVINALFQRGYRRILIEGGAHTVSAFVDAGCLDRLHLLVAPLLLGSGKTGLALRPIDKVQDGLRPVTVTTVFDDGDVLFDCDLAGQSTTE